MSTYEFDNERMSVEMTLGHAMQHIDKLYAQLNSLTQALHSLRSDVDSLIAHTGLPPRPQSKQPITQTR